MTKSTYVVVTGAGRREYSGPLGLGCDHTITGINSNPRHRAELQGQPKLKGFVGPCFDGFDHAGRPRIRYEAPDIYASYD